MEVARKGRRGANGVCEGGENPISTHIDVHTHISNRGVFASAVRGYFLTLALRFALLWLEGASSGYRTRAKRFD